MSKSVTVIKDFLLIAYKAERIAVKKYLLSIVCLAVFTLLMPLLNGLIVSYIEQRTMIAIPILLFIVTIIYSKGINILIGYEKTILSNCLVKKLQVTSFQSLINSNKKINEEYSKGEILSNIIMHISTVVNLGLLILSFFSNVIIAIVSGVSLCYLSPLVFLVGILCIPLILFINWKCNKGLTDLAAENAKMQALSVDEISNSILAYEELKFIRDKSKFRSSFLETQEWFIHKGLYNDMKINSPGYILDILTGVINVAGYVLGYMIIQGDSDKIARLVVLTSYLSTFIGKISFISLVKSLSSPLDYSLKQVKQYVNMQKESDENIITQNKVQINKIFKITMKGVSFGYNDQQMVLHNFSYKFSKCGIVILEGKSGSGKTTLIKLLLNYYKPVKGDIYVNRSRIENIDIESYINRISYFQQNGVLFSGTIQDNLNVFAKGYEKESADELLDVFGLKNELQNDIYNFAIQEAGKNISIGQRDRIKLTCILSKKSDIYILDEPSAALDQYNTKQLIKILKQKSKEALFIISTHDKSLYSLATEFIKMDENYEMRCKK